MFRLYRKTVSSNTRWVALGAATFGFGWLALVFVVSYVTGNVSYLPADVLPNVGILAGLGGGVTGALGVNLILPNGKEKTSMIVRQLTYAICAGVIVLAAIQLLRIGVNPIDEAIHAIFATFMAFMGALCGLYLGQYFEREP